MILVFFTTLLSGVRFFVRVVLENKRETEGRTFTNLVLVNVIF